MNRSHLFRAAAPVLLLVLATAGPALVRAGGPHGSHDPELVARYDADGDGELSRDERVDLMFDEHDGDGDGLISRDEWRAAHDARAARWAERRAELLDEYDADGDGELSREERHAAHEAGEFHRKRHGGKHGRGPRSHADGDDAGELD